MYIVKKGLINISFSIRRRYKSNKKAKKNEQFVFGKLLLNSLYEIFINLIIIHP